MKATIKTVDSKTLAGWLAANTALVVDVREPHEFQAGHIPGALLVPLSSFDGGKIPVTTDKHLVFHCHMGVRCGPASEKMAALGYNGDIFRLTGGFVAWARAGGAVER